MISFFSFSISSKSFLKISKQGSNKNNDLNITFNQGNLTIKDSNFTFTAENLNLTLPKILFDDKKDADIKIEEFKHPYLKRINNDIKNGIIPQIKLPKFMNKTAKYIGNGNYQYSNLTNGHSLTIHLEGINSTIGNENKTIIDQDPIKEYNKKLAKNFKNSKFFKNSTDIDNKKLENIMQTFLEFDWM